MTGLFLKGNPQRSSAIAGRQDKEARFSRAVVLSRGVHCGGTPVYNLSVF